MTVTPNLNLPELAAAQSQKHVTVNESLAMLDAIIQLSVINMTSSVPPGSPVEGDRYIVSAAATLEWVGWEDSVAVFSNNIWIELVPSEGWKAYDENTLTELVFEGSSWIPLVSRLILTTDSSTNNIVDNSDLSGNKFIKMTSSSANVVTVPAGLTGVEPVTIVQMGSGSTTIVADGVTINSDSGFLKIGSRYTAVSLIPDGVDNYLLLGSLVA